MAQRASSWPGRNLRFSNSLCFDLSSSRNKELGRVRTRTLTISRPTAAVLACVSTDLQERANSIERQIPNRRDFADNKYDSRRGEGGPVSFRETGRFTGVIPREDPPDPGVEIAATGRC